MNGFKMQTPKEKAHMLFKRHKAGMKISDDDMKLVKKFYPFMRG